MLDAVIINVTPEDEPYDFASKGPRTFAFHDGQFLAPLCKGNRTATIKAILKFGPISDAEWGTLEPILCSRAVVKGRKFEHDIRLVLDGIIEKLGTNTPWRKMIYKAGTWENAATYYRRWVKDGRWERVYQALARQRLPSSVRI